MGGLKKWGDVSIWTKPESVRVVGIKYKKEEEKRRIIYICHGVITLCKYKTEPPFELI
jgi:hypothetical protein